LTVEPPNEIAAGDVPDEQEKAVGGLVQSAVAQARAGHRARIDMVGLRAGKAALVVPAALIMPVATKFRAGGSCPKASLDFGPRGRPVLFHVCAGNRVADPLVAERRKQPVEDRRGVAIGNGPVQTCPADFGADLVEKGHRTR
jgi:hypothetical protein